MNQYFYGWIPCLTDEVLISDVVESLEYQGLSTIDDENSIIEIPNALRGFSYRHVLTKENVRSIRGQLLAEDTDKVFYFYKKDDDTRILDSSYRRRKEFLYDVFAFSINPANNQIGNIGAFEIEENGKEYSFHPYFLGSLLDIQPSGLFKYELSSILDYQSVEDASEIEQKIASKQLLSVIRDVFHSHIHDRNGDFALLPVSADSPVEAEKKIFKQYSKKMKTHTQYIKSILHPPDGKHIMVMGTKRLYSDPINRILGEMDYCLSFIYSSALENKERKINKVKNYQSTIKIFQDECNQIFENVPKPTAIVMLILATLGPMKYFYDIYLQFFPFWRVTNRTRFFALLWTLAFGLILRIFINIVHHRARRKGVIRNLNGA